ncbi:GRAM domain-containing protein, partial [Psidium guajava]
RTSPSITDAAMARLRGCGK